MGVARLALAVAMLACAGARTHQDRKLVAALWDGQQDLCGAFHRVFRLQASKLQVAKSVLALALKGLDFFGFSRGFQRIHELRVSDAQRISDHANFIT